MSWLPEFFRNEMAIQREMLRVWEDRHPREARAVREEATAKVENRAPNYGPQQAFG